MKVQVAAPVAGNITLRLDEETGELSVTVTGDEDFLDYAFSDEAKVGILSGIVAAFPLLLDEAGIPQI